MTELIAPLPRLTLSNGMSIAFEAISPTTGLAVTGVVVSAVAIYGDDGQLVDGTVGAVTINVSDTPITWAPTPATGI